MPYSFEVDTDVGNPLTTGQISYWPHEETSGNRSDLIGTNTLVDNNTVTSATGKRNNASQLTRANNEWYSVADNASLSPAGDFTFDSWFYMDSLPAGSILGIAGKGNAAGTQREFVFGVRQSTGRAEFYVSDTVDAPANSVGVEATTFGTLSTATWYYGCCRWTQSTGKAEISINGGTFDSATDATIEVGNSTADFTIGRRFMDETGVNFDGRLDETGFWSRLLTSTNVSDRYNGGSGNTMVLGGQPAMRRMGGVKHATATNTYGQGRTW